MGRGGRFLAIALSLALLLPATSASAESITQLKTRLEVLKKRSARAGAAFSSAYWKLDETEVALARTRRKIASTRKDLAVAKKRLGTHARGIYQRDRLDLLGFLVSATTFDDLIMRIEYLNRIQTADTRAIFRVKRLQRDLQYQRHALLDQYKSRRARVTALRAQRDRLQAQLRSVNREFRQVKLRLDAARSGGSLDSGISSAPGPNGMVFPVLGANYYANTWGASRSGGRRRHQGTDIMAARGTPVVAVLSGTVSAKNGGLGGKTIWLRASNGWSFYYAHLNGWAVRSGSVRAGQLIGWVGSTGNAAGGAPHLHFQIHPNGGWSGPVNPYPYLRAME